MEDKMNIVKRTYRYKDRGKIEYVIRENLNTGDHDLTLTYSDSEKTFSWDHSWVSDGKTALEHINEMTYEGLKEVLVQSMNRGLYGHKGEYVLLKDSIIIFVSHKEYIANEYVKCGLC